MLTETAYGEIEPKVTLLLKGAVGGDSSSLSFKEILRKLFERERDALKTTWSLIQENSDDRIVFDQYSQLVYATFDLAAGMLEGLSPTAEPRIHPNRMPSADGTSQAARLLSGLQKTGHAPAGSNGDELSDDVIATVIRAIGFADATDLLRVWHSNHIEVKSLYKQQKALNKEAAQRRVRAKDLKNQYAG